MSEPISFALILDVATFACLLLITTGVVKAANALERIASNLDQDEE